MDQCWILLVRLLSGTFGSVVHDRRNGIRPHLEAMLPRSDRLRELLRLKRPFSHPDRLILRDHLALERTRLANERTFMAYIRSALYLVIGGLALIQLEGHGDLAWVGATALALSAIFTAIGIVRFFTLRKQLDSYYLPLEDHTGDEAG